MSDWMGYPESQGMDVGCKVSWRYYDSKEDAEKCAEAAKNNGRIQASRGYDFGYCAPGSIELMKSGPNEGRYKVCLP